MLAKPFALEKRGRQHVILSADTVGEPIDRANRERESDHVMLSEAKHLRPIDNEDATMSC